MIKSLPELRYTPAVFAVGENYQIITCVRSELLLSVRVNGTEYFDHSNGIIRSADRIHKISVPMSELDRAGEYTVSYRRIIERKPYFTTSEEPVCATFRFRPLPTEGAIRIYQISDTHGICTLACQSCNCFGDIDLLILNGDIMNDSDRPQHFDLIYRLCENLTGGECPCVFSRGNHDLRGLYAEKIADYTPTRYGYSYFTFRLGRLWGIVLDCGEDKADFHAEYGNTVACHRFRLEQTAYLEQVIRNAEREYLAPGVEYRIVVSHVPFSYIIPEPFNIEQELYAGWLRLIGENIQPDLMLSGHLHRTTIAEKGGELDSYGLQPCPVLESGCRYTNRAEKYDTYWGSSVILDGDRIICAINNSQGEVRERKEFTR